jgi:hypothetical protein
MQDVVALLSTSDEGVHDFLRQPHLPNNIPIHAFVVPRKKIPTYGKDGTVTWVSAWFKGRDPHSSAVGAAHQHVLRSMLKLYPKARSVLVFEDDARIRKGSAEILAACSKYMTAHDDWDLFYLGHYPAWPTTKVAPHVVRTPLPLAAHAIIYHRRIIDEVLSWKFYLMGIDERIALTKLSWRKLAVYPDAFYQEREPLLSKLVRPLWPNVIGLPFVRTDNHRNFVDDLNHLMCKETRAWPMVMAWVVFFTVILGFMITWCVITCRQIGCAFGKRNNTIQTN